MTPWMYSLYAKPLSQLHACADFSGEDVVERHMLRLGRGREPLLESFRAAARASDGDLEDVLKEYGASRAAESRF